MSNTIKQRFFTKDTLPEWILSWCLLIWSLLFLYHGAEIYAQSQYQGFRLLAEDFKTWGYAALVISFIRMLSLTLNHFFTLTGHVRATTAGLSACMWASVWAAYWKLPYISTTLAVIGVIITLEFMNLWTSAKDAKCDKLIQDKADDKLKDFKERYGKN